MQFVESQWIGEWIAKQSSAAITPVLELGSADHKFRTQDQPHIDRNIHSVLRGRGIAVVHSDQKRGEGVDISGDIYSKTVQDKLRDTRARLILCCNIFEHVQDRHKFAMICDSLLVPDGLIIISVPFSYPYHPDPIDTGYRPSVTEVAELFYGYQIDAFDTIVCPTFWDELKATGRPWRGLGRTIAKIMIPVGGLSAVKARASRMKWLNRPYLQTIAVLKKPAAGIVRPI